MKDELGGKIMRKFVGLRAKIYSYLIDDGNEDEKGKGTKKCVIKRMMNDDKRMQSIDSIDTYAYGTTKDLVSEKEDIKCNNIIKRYKND